MNNSEKKHGNLYVTLIVILMSIAVIAAVAGAVSRNIAKETEITKAGETTREGRETKTSSTNVTEDVFQPSKSTEAATDNKSKADTAADDAGKLPQFINPTGGKVVKDYSVKVPVFSLTMNDYRTHEGIDIYVDQGERILATAAGVIDKIWEDPLMGYCISIKHSGNAISTYKNISKDLPDGIKEGKAVSAGDLVAVAGETALSEVSEESHVHYELSINGKTVNPVDYINFKSAGESYEG